MEVVQWVDEDAKEKGEYTEGSFVRVVGNVRSQGDKKHVMAFKIMGVPSQAEMDAHLLEIVHSHLKMKQVQTLLEGGATGGGRVLEKSYMPYKETNFAKNVLKIKILQEVVCPTP